MKLQTTIKPTKQSNQLTFHRECGVEEEFDESAAFPARALEWIASPAAWRQWCASVVVHSATCTVGGRGTSGRTMTCTKANVINLGRKRIVNLIGVIDNLLLDICDFNLENIVTIEMLSKTIK